MLVASGKSVLVKESSGKTFVDATRGGQVVIGVAVAPIVSDLTAKVSSLRGTMGMVIPAWIESPPMANASRTLLAAPPPARSLRGALPAHCDA
jgi:hypothetical protein